MSRLNSLLRVLTLRCEAASELSSRELDDSLPRLDRAALLCHVLACRSCRRFRAQVRLIRKAVRRRAAPRRNGLDQGPTLRGSTIPHRPRVPQEFREFRGHHT